MTHNLFEPFAGLRTTRPRTAMVVIGHRDYPNEVGLAFAEQAAVALRGRGLDLQRIGQPCRTRAEAVALADAVRQTHPDGVLIFLGTWIECPVAIALIREIESIPFALWGFGQFYHEPTQRKESTGSFVALAVLKGTLDRMGYIYSWIAGLPEDPAAQEQVLRFARVVATMRALRRAAIGLIGYASMGIYPATFDHVLLRRQIGPEVVHIDTSTLLHRMEQVPQELQQQVFDVLASHATPGDAEPHYLPKVARMTAALRALRDEYELDAVDLKCQYELSQDYGCTGCVPLSLLADLGIVAGCEGDIPTTATQAALAALSGEVTMYGDLLDWDAGNEVVISPCGYAPWSLCAAKPVLHGFAIPGFRGVMSSAVLKPGTITLARLGELRGGYQLQVLVGETVPAQPRQGRFPAARLRLETSLEEVMARISGQHYALVYGDRRADLRELCRYLGVEYVGY